MLDSKYIHDVCEKIAKTTGTRDTLQIMKARDIIVTSADLGNLLGMYSALLRNRFVILNKNLDEYMERMVCAHELGHDCLHRSIARQGAMQEFGLFNITNSTEYEANAFAAHLLMPDDDFLESLHEGKDVVQLSSLFGCNVNLVLIKVQEMVNLGYDLRVPMEPNPKFLKNITVQ